MRRRGRKATRSRPACKWLTIRSDNNDKYAQPDGVWLGQRGTPTNVGFDGPALQGRGERGDRRHRPSRDLARPAGLRRDVPLPHRPRAGDAGDRAGSDGRARRQGERSGPGQPRGQLRHQPAAGRRHGRGLRDRCCHRRAARRRRCTRKTIGADGRWGPFATDPDAARVRHHRARLRDHARLPLAVSALVADREPARPSASPTPTATPARSSR